MVLQSSLSGQASAPPPLPLAHALLLSAAAASQPPHSAHGPHTTHTAASARSRRGAVDPRDCGQPGGLQCWELRSVGARM